jgi:putative membrane protein
MPSTVHGGLPIGLSISFTLALIAVALVNLLGWYQLRSHPNALSVGRLAAFTIGVFSLWAAVASPFAALDHDLLTFHMVQHLLLMTVAAPLILLGAPATTLRLFSRRFISHAQGTLPQRSQAQGLGRIVSHPVFCWLASTITVIGWHVPALFELGLRSERWHEIEQASFLAAGLLFWWPVIQPWPSLARWPRWSVPLYLFLATLPCDALSAFLTFCNRVVYPHYLSAQRPFDISPLGDQECAGALMWVCVTFAYLTPAAVVTIQMLSPQRLASKAEAV